MGGIDLTPQKVRRRSPPSIDHLLVAIQRSGHHPHSIRVTVDGTIEIQFREAGEHTVKVEQVIAEVDSWFSGKEA